MRGFRVRARASRPAWHYGSARKGAEQKKALYKALVGNLARDAGVPAADVIINLVETRRENWSFGNGEAPFA